jgi:two-component system, cell cycle sensor histidine kinase and response regulator CckA
MPTEPSRPSPRRRPRITPLRIAAWYAALTASWIVASDAVLRSAWGETWAGFFASAGKGLLFTAVSAGWLYWLVRQGFREQGRARDLLRTVADGLPDAIFVKDRDGKYLLFNAAAGRFVGMDPADVIGKDDTELFDPAGARVIMARDRRVVQTGVGETDEETLTSAGATRTYLATKFPYRNEAGEVVGIVGISRDITDRKQAEAALRDERTLLRTLIDTIPDLVFTKDAAGRFGVCNKALVEFVGRPAEADLAGKTVFDLFPAADAREAHEDDQRVIRDGKPVFDREALAKDTAGRESWRLVNKVPLRDHTGAVVGLVGVSRDIQRRKEHEQQLAESRERLALALSAAKLGAWDWDLRTDVVHRSAECLAIFGDPGLAGDHTAFARALHPDDAPAVRAGLRQTIADRAEWATEFRIVRPDGAVRWVSDVGRPHYDTAGTPVRMIGVIQDVTDRKRVEERLRQSQALLTVASRVGRMGAWAVELPAQTVVWSDELRALYGLPNGRSPGVEEGISFYAPEDREAVRQAYVACVTDGIPIDFEARFDNFHGTRMWVRVIGEAVRDAAGTIVRAQGAFQDITDHKRAEAALRESEERYRLLFEANPHAMWVYDLETLRFLAVNDTAVRQYGYSRAEFLGMTIADIRPAGDRDRLHAAVGGLSPAPTPGSLWRHRRRDGSLIDVEIRSTDFESDGRRARLVLALDVTERLRAEAAVREAEQRFRLIAETIDEVFWITNPEVNRVLYVSPAYERVWGRPVADLESDPLEFVRAIHPDDRDRVAAAFHDPSGYFQEVYRVVRPDGSVRWVEDRGFPVRGETGAIECLVGSAQDVTARYQAQAERERSTELLRTVLGSVSDAILTIDERGIVHSANPATERMFGYSEADLVGRNVVRLMPEPHRSGHDGYIANYLRTGVAKAIGGNRELEAERKDGTRFPIELTVTEVTIDGARHFTGVIRDITGRKKLEAQFQQAQKMEAVGRLAGGVAHDFNNLLTVINGYADLMTATVPDADPNAEAVAAIRDAGERAARLTQQLLAFSRRSIVEPRVLDLNDVVTHIAALLRRLIGEDVTMISRLSPRLSRVRIDPGHLEQIIMNLAVNARDAMKSGGELTIETRDDELGAEAATVEGTSAPGRYVRLSVVDTGTGMTEEVRAKIFEPFFTTKEQGQGTGLGLATVYGLVRTANGLIQVSSRLGAGTRFDIYFPAVVEPAPQTAAEAARIAPRGTETVLLVEDEDAVRKLALIALRMQGYQVLEAANGEAAIRVATEHPGPIHLLVTDVVMPGMSGSHVAATVGRQHPEAKVLFMSGYTDDAVVRHGVETASSAFLHKPFTPFGLARKVRDVLDQK